MTGRTFKDIAGRSRPIRWLVALGLLIAGVLALNSGRLDSCDEHQSALGTVASVCARPHVDDPVVLGGVLIVLLLLAPELSEFGVPGLVTLRWRVQEQQSRADALEQKLNAVSTRVDQLSVNTNSVQASQNVQVTIGTGAISAQLAERGDDDREVAAASVSSPDRRNLLAQSRLLAGGLAVERILSAAATDAAGPLGVPCLRTHLYLATVTGQLLPVDQPGRTPAEAGFPFGVGVVGTVWVTGSPQVRQGKDVQQGLSGLPPERTGLYDSTTIVLAVPVLNVADRTIAVLSAASSQEPDVTGIDDALDALVAHSAALARVIVDLLEWENDSAAHADGQAEGRKGD